ncbi:hypothetical protein GCM10027563_21700 [Parasphingorhabdus pacifica]
MPMKAITAANAVIQTAFGCPLNTSSSRVSGALLIVRPLLGEFAPARSVPRAARLRFGTTALRH